MSRYLWLGVVWLSAGIVLGQRPSMQELLADGRAVVVEDPDADAEANGLIRCFPLPYVVTRGRRGVVQTIYRSREDLHKRHNRYLVGDVTKILDGDSFEIDDVLGGRATIHLQVNAPELRQPHGREAKAKLAELLPIGIRVYATKDSFSLGAMSRRQTGQRLSWREQMADRNEWVCQVDVDGGDIDRRSTIGNVGLKMVGSGHAWFQGKFDGKQLPEFVTAKDGKLGLWSQKKPVDPAQWFAEDEKMRSEANWPAREGRRVRDIESTIPFIEFIRLYEVEPLIGLTYEQAESLSEIPNPPANATLAEFERSNRDVLKLLKPAQASSLHRIAYHTFFRASHYELAAAQVPGSLSDEQVERLNAIVRERDAALARVRGGNVSVRQLLYQQDQIDRRFGKLVKEAVSLQDEELVGPPVMAAANRKEISGGMMSMSYPPQPYPRVF